MISIEHVTKKYGRTPAVEDVTCTIAASSIYGLIGYNGAGKTTLLKTIAGIYRPEKGRVIIDGQPVYENEKLKQRLFIMTEELYFLPQATLFTMGRFYKGYYPDWSDHTFARLLTIFNLDPAMKISGFSKGMQRQAGILLALSTRPRYLLLDEAFDGLDLAKRNLMKKLLERYVQEKNAIVIISSHNLREMEGMIHDVGMIKDHRLFFHSSVAELKRSRVKCRFSCSLDLTDGDLQGAGLKKLPREDGFYTCLAEGDGAAVRARITSLGGENIQVLPMTLEDFFLNEKEPETYDLEALF